MYILDNYTFLGIKLEKFSLQIVFQCNFDFIFVDLDRYHPFEAAPYNPMVQSTACRGRAVPGKRV